MTTFQIDNDDVVVCGSNTIVKWLKVNNLNDSKLIEELVDEGIENIDDLLIFKEEQLKERLLYSKRGIKIGIICKLIKALHKEREKNNIDDNKQQESLMTSVIMLDKSEKEAIQKLQFEIIKIQQKLKSLPQQIKQLSISKAICKEKINNICKEWILLLNIHKKLLYEWTDNIEQKQLNKYEKMNNELNNELNLLTETKTKCQSVLMSWSSVDDLWYAKTITNDNNHSKDNIVTIVNNCILKLNKSLLLSRNNIFDKIIFDPFDADKVKNMLHENIGNLLSKVPKLSVNVTNEEQQIEFVLDKQMNVSTQRELFVEICDSKQNDNDEKDADINMSKIVKLPIIESKYTITSEDLDKKLGKHNKYCAYIIDHFGKIAIKGDPVTFNISRNDDNGNDINTFNFKQDYWISNI